MACWYYKVFCFGVNAFCFYRDTRFARVCCTIFLMVIVLFLFGSSLFVLSIKILCNIVKVGQ